MIPKRVYAKINLDNIQKNIQSIKAKFNDQVAVMGIVKANGYGHGAVGIAPALMEAGAYALAVATLTEALELKEAYPEYPVFIMGHTPDRLLHYVVEKDIIQTVFSLEQVEKLGELATKAGKTATENSTNIQLPEIPNDFPCMIAKNIVSTSSFNTPNTIFFISLI